MLHRPRSALLVVLLLTLPLALAQQVPGDGTTVERERPARAAPSDPAGESSAERAPEPSGGPGPASGRARIIVAYEPGAGPRSAEAASHRASGYGATLARSDPARGIAVFLADDPEAAMRRARADPSVRYAEPDVVHRASYTPNDPRWSQQYGPAQVGATAAWDVARGTSATAVCVVDTGVRYTHEDLSGVRYKGGYDFVNYDATPLDDNGHGTHVAGIAAAAINNSRGIAGMGNVSYYAVKVLDANGSGYASDVAAGIEWCALNTMPRTVISLSLGSSYDSYIIRDAIALAVANGKLVVAATGNDGCSPCVGYPAAYPEVVAVGCTTSNRSLCSFSNGGPQVDLVAPGSMILSTWHTANNSYVSINGTSMSTPHVSGAAALVWSRYANATAEDVRVMLEETARDLGTAGPDASFGKGELNLSRAISARVPSVPRFFNATFVGARVELSWTPPAERGGANLTYQVFRSFNNGTPALVASLNATAFGWQDGSCSNVTQCRYSVRAVNVHGPGPLTPEQTPRANGLPILGTLRCGPAPIHEGDPVHCLLDVRDDSYGVAANVSWGDGTRERLPATGVMPAGPLNVTHVFASAGNFTVNVSVQDSGGRSVTRSASVLVLPHDDCGTGGDAGDWFDEATFLTLPVVGCSGLMVGTDEDDFYAVNLTAGEVLEVTLTPASGDFDLCAYAPSLGSYDCSFAGGNATDSLTLDVSETGEWFIRVLRYFGEGNYTLWVDAGPGGGDVAPVMRSITCLDNPARAGDVTTCLFRATDEDSERVYYVVDWDDGSQTRVPESGTLRAGATASATHEWPTAGLFVVTVWAFDLDDNLSEGVATYQFVED